MDTIADKVARTLCYGPIAQSAVDYYSAFAKTAQPEILRHFQYVAQQYSKNTHSDTHKHVWRWIADLMGEALCDQSRT